MPHVPLHTQARAAELTRVSPYPILTSLSDAEHKNFVQSTITGRAARGLASVEYVLESRMQDSDSPSEEEHQKRRREVEDAVEWEKEARKRRQGLVA